MKIRLKSMHRHFCIASLALSSLYADGDKVKKTVTASDFSKDLTGQTLYIGDEYIVKKEDPTKEVAPSRKAGDTFKPLEWKYVVFKDLILDRFDFYGIKIDRLIFEKSSLKKASFSTKEEERFAVTHRFPLTVKRLLKFEKSDLSQARFEEIYLKEGGELRFDDCDLTETTFRAIHLKEDSKITITRGKRDEETFKAYVEKIKAAILWDISPQKRAIYDVINTSKEAEETVCLSLKKRSYDRFDLRGIEIDRLIFEESLLKEGKFSKKKEDLSSTTEPSLTVKSLLKFKKTDLGKVDFEDIFLEEKAKLYFHDCDLSETTFRGIHLKEDSQVILTKGEKDETTFKAYVEKVERALLPDISPEEKGTYKIIKKPTEVNNFVFLSLKKIS